MSESMREVLLFFAGMLAFAACDWLASRIRSRRDARKTGRNPDWYKGTK